MGSIYGSIGIFNRRLRFRPLFPIWNTAQDTTEEALSQHQDHENTQEEAAFAKITWTPEGMCVYIYICIDIPIRICRV